MNAISLISEALSHAGEDQQLMERLAHLEQRRITPDKELPPMEFLFRLFGKPCFPRGELVGLTGKPKSGKTFISSILMTLCFREEVLTMLRESPEPLRVLWYDTEQSDESTQDILKNRIVPMISGKVYGSEFMVNGIHPDGNPINHKPSTINPTWNEIEDKYQVFNVRQDQWRERLPLLEAAIERYKPDLVILDGIRDLVNDINDGVMAQDVIERLMHLASEQHCCLVCILHQNKGAEDKNLRGWIGTELKNKAFEVYECTKDADRIFTWSQTDTRKYDIVDKLKYIVGEDGIPQLCSVEQILENQSAPSSSLLSRPLFNEKYVLSREGKNIVLDIPTLFADAFRPGEQKSAAALQATIMSMANITSYKFYNRRREEAVAQGVIVQDKDADGHIVYTCPRKPAVPDDALRYDDDNDTHPRQMELFENLPNEAPF